MSVARSSKVIACHISASVKSGAAAMPISAAIAIRPGERGEQRDPAAHRRADQDQRSVGQPIDHRQRVVGPAADGAVLEPAAAGAVAGIVEAQHGLAAFGAERRRARSPCRRSCRCGSRAGTRRSGPRPSCRAQASSTPSPRSSRPVVSMASDPEEQPVQRARDVVAIGRHGADGVSQLMSRQSADQRQRHGVAPAIMIDQRQARDWPRWQAVRYAARAGRSVWYRPRRSRPAAQRRAGKRSPRARVRIGITGHAAWSVSSGRKASFAQSSNGIPWIATYSSTIRVASRISSRIFAFSAASKAWIDRGFGGPRDVDAQRGGLRDKVGVQRDADGLAARVHVV